MSPVGFTLRTYIVTLGSLEGVAIASAHNISHFSFINISIHKFESHFESDDTSGHARKEGRWLQGGPPLVFRCTLNKLAAYIEDLFTHEI